MKKYKTKTKEDFKNSLEFQTELVDGLKEHVAKLEEALDIAMRALEFYESANWQLDCSSEDGTVQGYAKRAYNDRGHRSRVALKQISEKLEGK